MSDTRFERGSLAPQGDEVVVGRDAARSHLVLQHPAVSGAHASFHRGRRTLRDLGSTSGTYVAGRRLGSGEEVQLAEHEAIAFGPVVLVARDLFVAAGVALAASSPHAPAAAAPVTGGQPKHRTIIGELQMDAGASTVTIGRTPDNQIVVPQPQVSSHHAQVVKVGEQLFLEDRGSANGTFVRGQRLMPGQRVQVANGEKVFLGPMPLVLEFGAGGKVGLAVEDEKPNWAGRPLYEIEAWDLSLEVQDRDDKSKQKVLLDHVSFKALPGDMIALMGPSGAGKTTLLLALNGYLPPTTGQVRVNGENLYAVYDALRGSIGYVPQDDLVHPELTVFEAVRYSARFRLPPDYTDAEIDQRVEATLRDLGLESLKNLQIGKPEKKVLSGGQRKRVNIALELVTDPVILFLDEPTSGLASDDTTALINLLAELTKRTGKTIVMTIHQPAKDEFEKFSHAFVMGYGGITAYFGPTGDSAYKFFANYVAPGTSARHIDNPRDMFDMLHAREKAQLEEMKRRDPNVAKNEARLEASRGWRNQFFAKDHVVYAQMYSGRRAIGTDAGTKGVPSRPRVNLLHQLGLLMSRYRKVRLRDTAGASIMFLQAPVIGLMLWFVFGNQKRAVPFWCLGALQELSKRGTSSVDGSTDLLNRMTATSDHSAAMFFVVVSCVWFGTSNAAREIVTERAIYLRERMVNLNPLNYVLSKFIPLALVGMLQCTMLLGIVFLGLGFHGGPLAFVRELTAMVAVALSATALGLLLSTVVASAEAAMALTPIALIPQVVLGGLMVPMTTNDWLRPLMYIMPARWGFEGAITHERLAVRTDPAWLIDLKKPDLNSAPDFVTAGRFDCAVAQVAGDNIAGAWGFVNYADTWLPVAVLFGMTALSLLSLLVILRSKDPV